MSDEIGATPADVEEPGAGNFDTSAAPEGGESAPASPDPLEAAAREKGWKPKEEFEGNEADWVDAKEFVRREPFFDKIRHQSKEIKKLQKTIEGMVQHYHADVQARVQKQLAELRAAKTEAIEIGDVAGVAAIEQQITQTIASAPRIEAPQVDTTLTEWVAAPQNQWFNEDQDMRDFAIAHNESWLKRNPGKIAESLKATDEAVRRAYPDKFKQVIKPPTPESGTSARQGGGKYDRSRLSPEQKLAYKQMVERDKILSHDEYFKSLEEIGALA